MRYQDWDVLLFPSGGGSHIPFKEFRTAYYAEAIPNSSAQVPLLATFVPSLPRGTAFQVSIHSWLPTRPQIRTLPDGVRVDEVWEVRIVVDGKVEGVVHLPCEAVWPQIVASIGSPALGHHGAQLHFPPFHQEIMLQAGWCAADRKGRIRVELGAGYYNTVSGRFTKTYDIVTFAFQHAPTETLERCGVAWPNCHMLANPIMDSSFFNHQVGPADVSTITKRKAASTSNIRMTTATADMIHSRPLSPLRTFDNGANDAASNYDLNSRSTSAYSTIPDTAGPLLTTALYQPIPTYPSADGSAIGKPLSVRLPSDQLQKIINALHPKPQNPNSPTSMPPPPVPHRALPSTAGVNQAAANPTSHVFIQTSSGTGNITNRREESRISDVSMHTACTTFPICTTEDTNGKIVHTAADVPAGPVKGKKEGSSAPKRKSSISSPKSGQAEKKRPRRSTRLLQHDSGYAGSPSSEPDASTGEEPTVLQSGGHARQEASSSGFEGAGS